MTLLALYLYFLGCVLMYTLVINSVTNHQPRRQTIWLIVLVWPFVALYLLHAIVVDRVKKH